MKKAASLYDASLLEADNESQDKPSGEEGEFMIIGQHSFYRKMYLSVIYCCCHFLIKMLLITLFDKFSCHLQGANTKISLKQKAINTQHMFMCRMDHSDIICKL
jgi:hypothetical protein